MPLTIHYLVNARLPHTRAYGIQIAKMCEAFIEAGANLTLVIPRTLASRKNMREVNGLRIDVPTVILPGVDFYDRGRLGLLCSSLVFMISSFFYLLWKRFSGRLGIVYTIDMDTFSYLLLPFLGAPSVAEMHGAKRPTLANTFFLKRVNRIIATNSEIKNGLAQTFLVPREKIIVEPNGVDTQQFASSMTKENARRQLSLPAGQKIALYVGRFYKWKGLKILIKTCAKLPDINFYVIGGSQEQFTQMFGISHGPDNLPNNLHIAGDHPSSDVPIWLSAADVLLVLGTEMNENSFRFTSPMKIYEYMSARRPIVASRTPAIQSIISGDMAIFYSPDDAEDLAKRIQIAVREGSKVDEMITRALDSVGDHTWAKRAQRILEKISVHIAH